MRLFRRFPLILAALGLAAAAALALSVSRSASDFYLTEGRDRAEATLALTLHALDGHLRRYESVPDILADDDDLRSLLSEPTDQAARDEVNVWLKQMNAQLDSSDIYVMTPDGVTIAASNHDSADSFVGQNFNYRPYFTAAIKGGKGRFYAIGTTSGVRGYYFAAPVRGNDGAISGAIAVKIGLDATEAEWRAQEAQIMVTDPEGIVFLSTDPHWLYKAILPLTADRLARTAASRRYADLVPAPLDHVLKLQAGSPLIKLPDDSEAPRDYVMASQMMPRAGWTVRVLLDTSYLYAQARLVTAAALMFLGALAAVAVVIVQRRAQLADRIALQERTKTELEQRVIARTSDLARANALIETEVEERRLTEAELRRIQGDLVQAGKLAALGQMSAALSHEINQPLAAARNYADSAAILIDRGDSLRARENVTQILSLIDRMAAIARHLRHVARKPDAPLQRIDLHAAVNEAIALASQRLAGVSLTVTLPDDLPFVRGGPVRLQQVLVNLLSNAADAMEDHPAPRIDVTADVTATRVRLNLRDTGPGVPQAIADRIFDPFFTTKRVGSGLGLGLSISYNILKDFGGDLRVSNHPDGGAVFTLDLAIETARAEPPRAEAAE